MIRKIFPFVVAALLISSCGNRSGKGTGENVTGTGEAAMVQFASLVENPGNYIDKDIIVEGKVVHVCPHTGKKMFIVGENPDIMLYVSADENTPKFPMELLGSRISVEGRLAQAITADKPAMEPMNAGMANAACSDTCSKSGMEDPAMMAGAGCETETALSKQVALADLIMIYNKHILVK